MNLNISLEKQYALMLSGGISSSVLLYLMMKDTPTANIQPFTVPIEGATVYANSIIDHFNSKFGWTIPHTIEVGNVLMTEFNQKMFSAIKQVRTRHNGIEVFLGRTSTPDLPHHGNAINVINMPFEFKSKDYVLQLVYDEDLEDIINLTHSCEALTTGRCNFCARCSTRHWSFARLGKTDTGTQ
jgi:hypothetical protein